MNVHQKSLSGVHYPTQPPHNPHLLTTTLDTGKSLYLKWLTACFPPYKKCWLFFLTSFFILHFILIFVVYYFLNILLEDTLTPQLHLSLHFSLSLSFYLCLLFSLLPPPAIPISPQANPYKILSLTFSPLISPHLFSTFVFPPKSLSICILYFLNGNNGQ